MLSLIYISGDKELDEEDDDTKYSDYFDALNRGNLKIPQDNIVSGDAKVEN